MPQVIEISEREAERRLAQLVERSKLSREELERKAREYLLTPEERNLWETIRTLEYLLGDD